MNQSDSANSVTIESHRGSRRYNPMILGQFLEHFHRQVYGGVFEPGSPLAGEHGFRMDVVEAIRELKVPIVRWPGGCFVSAYHWADGVGPGRQPAYDKAWQVEDPNTFGTDEFVDWCRLIGAEPFICTNAGTGTPEEMSDWVEYCNLESAGKWARLRRANGHDTPHNVKYWSIGNENYGFWEMGAKTSKEWGHFVAESAKMMRKVDPEIKLLAAAAHDVDWNLELVKQAGEYLDFISIHLYADLLHQVDEPSDFETCMSRTLLPEELITMTEEVIAVAGYKAHVKIAFDEWNLRGWHHPSVERPFRLDVGARDRNDINATYTMADAVFSACLLNSCLRHSESVGMANLAPVINTRGPLFVHPEGVVKRTTYHVMQMYANHLHPNVVDVWVDCEALDQPALTADAIRINAGTGGRHSRSGSGEVPMPALDVIATCDDPGREWSIGVVNRHPKKSISCTIGLGNRLLSGEFDSIALCGSSPDSYNDIDTPEEVTQVSAKQTLKDGQGIFPPHSVTIVKIGKM